MVHPTNICLQAGVPLFSKRLPKLKSFLVVACFVSSGRYPTVSPGEGPARERRTEPKVPRGFQLAATALECQKRTLGIRYLLHLNFRGIVASSLALLSDYPSGEKARRGAALTDEISD